MQAASITTAQRHSANQPNHTHKNSGTSGNNSSTSCTPSANMRSRMQHSGVPPPTHQPGHAAAVMKQQQQQCKLVQLTRRITRLENEAHLAMAVMDKDTCKLLNYRQLMNSPKYKKAWSLSAANKFGRLANGIALQAGL
jgi:hypothetical protein